MSGDGARVAYPLFQEEDGGANPTSPLQLNIYEISVERAVDLNKQWHSRLPKIDLSYLIRCGNLVCYGAEFNNKIYACAIWTYPIAGNRLKNGFQMLELRRMAISADAPKNTASRMIAIMTKMVKKKYPQTIKLISYQDTGVHEGTIYKASGWTPVDVRDSITDWTKHKRPGGISQATTPKIRWEKDLK